MRFHCLRFASKLALVASLAAPVYPARYAILIGVSRYENSGVSGVDLNLDGPEQDVASMRQALISKQDFKENDIKLLQNQAASRQAILDTLRKSIAGLSAGDYLLIYFSGHGTSAFDRQMRPVESFIGPNSGALAPYDLKLDSTEHAAESLIIGRRDLRPLLSKLPQGSQTLVILDACYSENSVKSVQPRLKGKNRGINLGGLPATSKSTELKHPSTTPDMPASQLGLDADPVYPYSNVVALTAASKEEAAVDLDENSKVQGRIPTLDGKPHGVFTNSLLEAMNGAGDLNHDGRITFQELYEYTRRSVQAHYSQTPQLLMPSGQMRFLPAFIAQTASTPPPPRLIVKTTPCASSELASMDKLTVRVEDGNESLREKLASIEGIQITATGGDLVIHPIAETKGFELYDSTGGLVRRFDSTEVANLMDRIAAERSLRRFVNVSFPCQSSTVSLDLQPEGQSRFSNQDSISVKAQLERSSYLVLFDIDQSGAISIIYPALPGERQKQSPGTISLGSLKASAPFGAETLKLFALSVQPPLELLGCKLQISNNLECPVIEPNSAAFKKLIKFAENSSSDTAESRLRFITYLE